MKLYETAMTPSCRRVSIFLKELGIDVERVQVDVRGGENLSDTFKSKSLNGKVPLLELDEGTTLCESVAICRYFDLTYPNTHKLFGDSALEQAQVEMWHRVVEFQGLYAGFQAFRNLSGIYKDREHCVYAWGEESKARVAAFCHNLSSDWHSRDLLPQIVSPLLILPPTFLLVSPKKRSNFLCLNTIRTSLVGLSNSRNDQPFNKGFFYD